MNIFHALILSIVEGITEFLPISSTGHLMLTAKLLQISQSEFIKSFERRENASFSFGPKETYFTGL